MLERKRTILIRLYLDNCCLNRPFDDQTVERIRFESEAVLIVMQWSSIGKLDLLGSQISFIEIEKNPDIVRKERLQVIAACFSEVISVNDTIRNMARELVSLGFAGFDAFHIACAEAAGADFLLTTDDQIIRNYRRHKDQIRPCIENPVTWVEKNL